ncbi:MAG: hypothetical protein WCY01_03020 [Alkalispirochaeta sp.]
MTFEKSLIDLIPQKIRDEHKGKSVIQAGWATGPAFIVRKTEDYPEAISLQDACTWLEGYREIFRACHILFSDRSVAWIHRYDFYRYDPDDTELKKSGFFVKAGSETVNINLDMEI